MTQITATADVLQELATGLKKVKNKGERVIFEEDGHPVAALIPMEDLELLERLIREEEDRIDNQKVDEALKEPGFVTLEELRAKLGI